MLNSSMENIPQKKKSRRKRTQAFYPMPMPSMTDLMDQDSISTNTSDEDDEAYDTDEDGYITTLVSKFTTFCLHQLSFARKTFSIPTS